MTRTVGRRRLVPAFLTLVCLAWPPGIHAQVRLTFNGTDFTGWKSEHTEASIKEGVLHVGAGSGWVRSERVFADFVMKLDVRLPRDGAAGIFVRAWPTFSRSRTPSNGYRLQLTAPKSAAADAWLPLEVECIGGSLKVRMDGVLVHSVDTLENPQGHVALWSTDRQAQFRNIEIVPTPLARGLAARGRAARGIEPPEPGPGVVTIGAGVVSPKVVYKPQPRYTADAMRARITGTIRMSAVVLADGTVSDVTVLQSLDPKYGLDRMAVAAAQGWRFEPGTRAGEPVAVRIMIDLDFNLK